MSSLEIALAGLSAFLEEHRIPYMVIGGFANLFWGRPRLTQALDVTIQVAEADLPRFLDLVRSRYSILTPDPVEFVRRARVLPVQDSSGIRVDLILAGMPYEDTAIRRAPLLPVAAGLARVCTAEDLILHKLASARPRDREDVEGIVHRQGTKLDGKYLDPPGRGSGTSDGTAGHARVVSRLPAQNGRPERLGRMDRPASAPEAEVHG